MEQATSKQVIALKRFAKNPELSQGVLKGVEFDRLSKQDATELIKKCIAETNEEEPGEASDEFVMKYAQNYKNGNGAFATIILTDEELDSIRRAHREHCAEVLRDCEEDYPDDKELQISMFDKRADKVFSWIQQALDEKVRKTRGANNGSQY
jgi:hypothetical protein